MSYCWKCGNRLEPDMDYCPKCGTRVTANQKPYPARSYPSPSYSLMLGGIAAIVIVAGLIIALITWGLIPISFVGSGTPETRQFNFTDFTAISAGSGFTVNITQASTYSVRITADNNMFDSLEVQQNGETLMIGVKPSLGVRTTVLRADITMPDLSSLQFSGGVQATVTDMNLNVDVTIDMSGGSRLVATGSAANITALVGSGGVNINLGDFVVGNAQVDLSGGSQATVNLNGKLDATLSGGSTLNYKGNPTLGTIDASSGSSIHKIP